MWGFIFVCILLIIGLIGIIVELLRIPSVFLVLFAYLLGRQSKN